MSKLIFTEPQEEEVAKALDDAISTGLIDKFDGKVFKMAVGMLNENFSDDIPLEFHDEIRDGVLAWARGDVGEATEQALDLIEEAVAYVMKNHVRKLFKRPIENMVFSRSGTGQGPKDKDPDD